VVESGARRGVRWGLVQVGLAGAVGAVAVPMGTGLVVAALVTGQPVALVAAAGCFAAAVAALALVAAVAPEESRLTGSRGGRVLWGLLVGGLGVGLWLLGWGVGDEAGLGISGDWTLWMPACVVPFALVAGMLLRRWYLALGSLAVVVALSLVLLHALAAALPSEVDERLARAGVSRESIMVTAVPGYHVRPQPTSWQLEPDDRTTIPPSPYVSLYPLPDAPDCETDPYDSKYPAVQACEVESPGLAHLRGAADSDAYVRRVEGGRLLLTAPKSFDRAVLRDAVLAARATEPAGSFTTTVPGYTATSTSPDGTSFTPDDRALLPGARNISVDTHVSTGGECAYGAAACEVESRSLRYERYDDNQGYVRLVGDREVRVQGGMAVTRDVLRTAALTAHPATDDDLRLLLPPSPSTPDRSVLGAVRRLAGALYGTR
jgi:hypothetical protein